MPSFGLIFSPVPLTVDGKLKAGSVDVFRYFCLAYSTESFLLTSEGKCTRKVFRELTELMVTKDHEFVGKSPFPALLLIPHSHGHIPLFGEAGYKDILRHLRVRKTEVFLCTNADPVYL